MASRWALGPLRSPAKITPTLKVAAATAALGQHRPSARAVQRHEDGNAVIAKAYWPPARLGTDMTVPECLDHDTVMPVPRWGSRNPPPIPIAVLMSEPRR
jgi:hypothetical protein